MTTATIEAKPIMQNLRIRVRGMRVASLRLRAAALIFRVGGRVAGIPIDIDADSGVRRELLPENDRRIDRRVGCVYVSTHSDVAEDGTRWRTWDRIKLPN